MKEIKRLLLICLCFTLMFSCGSDDDDDNSSGTADAPPIEREEGQVPTGNIVIINNFNPTIRITNKIVEVNNREIFFNFFVRNADPVNHQHIVYRGRTCREVLVDRNNDDVIEREEAEQESGGPVVILDSVQGESYNFQDRVPADQFPANQENYILVVYGTEESANHPIACFSFKLDIDEPTNTTGSDGTTGGTGTTGTTTTGTTGTTTGGTGTSGSTGTTGTTGTTTGGTTTGSTTGGGPTACVPADQVQTITAFYNSLPKQTDGSMVKEPGPNGESRWVGQGGTVNITGSWTFTGFGFTGVPGPGTLNYKMTAVFRDDGCLYVSNQRATIQQATSNVLRLSTFAVQQQITRTGNGYEIIEVSRTGARTELDMEVR